MVIMVEKLTRRTFLKTTFGAMFALAGLGSGGYVYAHNIEPSLLDISTIQIKHPLIPRSFDGVKMVQFSDTHLGFQYNLHQLSSIISKINKIKPDIVLFTGDLMDNPRRYKQINQIGPILKNIKAPLGKLSIFGNHDHGGYGSNIYRQIMDDAGFTLLQNQSIPIQGSDGSQIYLLGIDDAMLGQPDFNVTQKDIPDQTFKILLSHAPDLADRAAHFDIHWQLSGHSHGGQVKIPFIGALIKPPYARKYPEGHYLIGEYNPLHLYVNRGLGTTRLPFRFMARPELTIYTLQSSL